MGFGIKTWMIAAAAAVLNTAAMFYAAIFGRPLQPYSIETSPAAGIAVFISGLLCLAEYIFVGRRDVGSKQRIYRFVQHNLLSFLAAYGGFIIYSAARLQDTYVLDTVVFNSLIPACFQRFFMITAAGWIVCGIIGVVSARRLRTDDNSLDTEE